MTRTLVLEHSLKRRTLQLLLFLYYAIIYSWRRTRRPPIKTFFESLRTHDRERENMIYWTHGEQSKIKLFRLNFSYNAKRPPLLPSTKSDKKEFGTATLPHPSHLEVAWPSQVFTLIFFSSLSHSFKCINVPSEIALAQLRTGKKRTAIRRPDHEQRIWEKSSHTVPTLCIEETKLRFSSTNIRLIMHAPMFASLCPIFNRTYIVMHCKVLPMEICAFELLLQQLLNLLLK